jgi:hypothetical protein
MTFRTPGQVVLGLSLVYLLAGSCDPADHVPAGAGAPSNVAAAQPEPPAAPAPGRKIALLVGIADYAPGTGWLPLNTRPDVERMRGALEAHGFAADDIHELTDPEADRAGIEGAFRTHLLDAAREGTIAVFHYSGHGHRLTDDDHDELDGYDEVLVPFDAPQNPPSGYTGDRHLRDDDLHGWLQELRRAVGPTGDVVVSLDSCFSGSATRSLIDPTATARGSLEPIGPPQTPVSENLDELAPDRAGGFDETATRGSSAAGPADPALAPYVFFSASLHNELAFETRNEAQEKMGSLSFALSSALARAGAGDTYRGLFRQVERIMAGRVRNTPQSEGMLERELFAGRAVPQQEFLEIAVYDAAARTARVRGGALAALLPGSRVVVNAPETREADPSAAWAHGSVVSATPFLSEVAFDFVEPGADVASGWVFVVERSYGGAGLRVTVEASAGVRAALGSAFAQKRFLDVVTADGEVTIRERDGELLAAAADGSAIFREPAEPPHAVLAGRLLRRLDDYSRNRWLRRLEEHSRDYKVRLEIEPCRLETTTTALGQELVRCGGPIDRSTAGGELQMRIGDGYELVIVNEGRKRARVAVLDLWSDGRITQLWPFAEERGADKVIEPGATFKIEEPFEIGPPTGSEMLKLMATDQFVDYWPITSEGARAGAPRGLFDTLFAGAFEGTRSEGRISVSSVGTYSLTFNVVEGNGG